MAGHSKWANIKHRKAAQDVRKGKIFTRLIREITIASRTGGEYENNPRLRTAVQTALSHNMTRDTIDRAIKRGQGEEGEEALEEIRYEGYGPGGVAIMVDCYSNNRNRTAGEVRHAFTKNGGSLGVDGSVSYLFKQTGLIQFSPETPENDLIEAALECSAEDIISESEGFTVITKPADFSKIAETLEEKGFKALQMEVSMLPATEVQLEGELAAKLIKLIDTLEDLDDVQNVYCNAILDDSCES